MATLATMAVEMKAVWERGQSPTEQIQKSAQGARSALANLFAAGVVIDQFRRAGVAASNLEQAVGGTSAVFKEFSTVIDEAAEGSARAVGLSERAFRQATSQIGAQLQGLGLATEDAAQKSIELTRVGADLAATFGGSTADAVDALGAAFRGEYDTVERFGLVLTASKVAAEAVRLGLADSTSAIDDNARAQATLSLITQQSAGYLGTWANELDTAAGSAQAASQSWEDAQASLGQALLPIMAQAANLVATLAEGFAALPQPVQTAVLALGAIAVIVGPIRNAITAVGGLTTSFKTMGVAAKTLTVSMGAIGIIATAAAGIYSIYSDRKAEATARTQEFVDALKAEAEGQEDATTAALTAKLAQEDLAAAIAASGIEVGDFGAFVRGEAVPSVEKLLGVIAEAGQFPALPRTVEGWNAALRDMGIESELTAEQAGVLATQITALQNAYEAAVGEVERTTDTNEALTESMDVASDAATRHYEALHEATLAAEELDKASGRSRNSLEEMGRAVPVDKLEELSEKLDDVVGKAEGGLTANSWISELDADLDEAAAAANDLATAMERLLGGPMSEQEAVDNLNAELDNLTTSLEDNGRTLDANTDAGRANREQIRTNIDAIGAYGAAMLENGKTTEEASQVMGLLREQLINQVQPFFDSREAAEEYVNTLGLTPENIETAVELTDMEASKRSVDDYTGQLEAVPADVETTVTAKTSAASEALRSLKTMLDGIRSKEITITAKSAGFAGLRPFQSSSGRFVSGGTNMLSTLGEIGGRAGDEVVLPLGNLPKMRDLIDDERVGPRIAEAMGGGGGSVTVAAPGVDVVVMIDGRVVDAVVQKRLHERDRMAGAGRR